MNSLKIFKKANPVAVPGHRTETAGNKDTLYSPGDFLNPMLDITPLVEVSENAREITIKAEIPGMDQKDIHLTYNNGTLRIQGKKKEEKQEGLYYSECSYGAFTREIAIGKTIDPKKIKAQYTNGILTVSMPKKNIHPAAIQVKIN